MKKILLMLSLTPLFAFAQTTANKKDDLQVYKDAEAHYLVSYPTSWIRRDQKIPGHTNAIEFISPRHEGSLLIMTAQEGANCKEVLTKLENTRKLTNTLKPDQRAVSAAELQSAHAQEGARGQYEFASTEKTQSVEQHALCLRKGSVKQVLLGTFRKKNGPDALEAMLKSFSFQETH